MALAMGLAAAPVVEAAANTTGVETLATAKKKTVKKTAKKTTKKTTTTAKKSSSTTKKTATTKTTAATAATSASTGTTTKTDSTAKVGDTAKTATETSSSNRGSLLGGIISALGGGSKDGSLLSGLSTIFDATKGATKDRIIGSWTYTEPAVVFSSKNVLSSIGGKIASQGIEKKLQEQFEKAGIKKGMMTMTFDKDGKFTQVIGKRTTSGTYTISDHNVVLNYGGKIKQIVGTTQLDGNDLLIVMDASKLLKYANVLGSLTGSSALKSLGSAVSSLDGMEVGLKLNK